MSACPSGSVNCSFPVCAVASPNQKAQTTSSCTIFVAYKEENKVPSLKLYLSFFDLKMFPCFALSIQRWNGAGWGVYTNDGSTEENGLFE